MSAKRVEALESLIRAWRRSARFNRKFAKDMLANGSDVAAQYFRTKAELESRHARDVAKILRSKQ